MRSRRESILSKKLLDSRSNWRYGVLMIIVFVKLCLAGAAGLVILALL
jgi:hypothetical protein